MAERFKKIFTFWGIIRQFTYDLIIELFTDSPKKQGPEPTWSLGRILLVTWFYWTVYFMRDGLNGFVWMYWYFLGFMLIGYVFGTKVVSAVLSRATFTGNASETIETLSDEAKKYLTDHDHV
jgi:hypothetical protein